MRYLIDGNNVCGAGRDRRLGLPTERADLIRRLDAHAARCGTKMTVVFDGPARSAPRQARPRSPIRIAYSGHGRSADELLIRMVRASRAPADIMLVSSDRALRDRVVELGGRVMGCRRFAALLAESAGQVAAARAKKT